MKSRMLTCIITITLFIALAAPVPLLAQEQAVPQFTVKELGTLGGTLSWATAFNNKGSVVGYSSLTGDSSLHAFVWHKGVMRDLGTLGGPNSMSFAVSERDVVVGVTETSIPDPNGEDACGFGTHLICLPFIWQDGVMTALPTLGGNNGQAVAINGRGEVAGFAENSTLVSDCSGLHMVEEGKPVIWKRGEVQELPTLASDAFGFAVAINNRRQSAGFTFSCADSHPVLWQRGTATNLRSLGGSMGDATAINDQGQVVGVSNLPADATFHAFLWQNGVIADLGVLPGFFSSGAAGINIKSQIVGQSCNADFSACIAFFWQNDLMMDLNNLVPAVSPFVLFEPTSINARGEIVGAGLDTNTFEVRAFLATPCGEDHARKEDCEGEIRNAMRGEISEKEKVALPENLRTMLQQSLRIRGFMRSPLNVALSDTPSVSRPNATLSPSSLTFPTQVIGTTSAAKTVTLKNTGTASLTISSIAITGTNAEDFAQTHTCRSSLAAGASCGISVTFKPTASGTRTAAVSVTDNAAGSPQKVAFSGIGVNGGTLTGYCVHGFFDPHLGCGITSDPTQCPPGALAINPVTLACGRPGQGPFFVDEGRSCRVLINGHFFGGACQYQ
jgi:probable HAF family extracellular repeat protein